MTPEEIGTELTNLKIAIGTYRAEVSSQNFVTNASLDSINKHLAALNSKVATHEAQIQDINLGRQKQRDWVENRENSCPNLGRIIDLETKDKIGMSLKSFMIGSLVLICSVIGGVYSTIKIVESHQQKLIKQEIKAELPALIQQTK